MNQEQFKNEIVPLRPQLLSYAQRLMENTEEAEDIVQEAFLKLWCIRDELAEYNSIPALAVQITKRLCLNRLKVLQRQYEDVTETQLAEHALSPHQLLEEKDEIDKIMNIIHYLPNLQQTILRMKHLDGMEIEEIAQLTGSKPEAIRMNLSRARKKVRDIFFKMQV